MQSPINSIGVLGGKGMLGSDLVRFLGERYETHAIDRDNYDAYRGRRFDALVNANGNSRRFWANEHPLEDFEASTVSVYRSIADFAFDTYIYISSSDVYADHSGPATTEENGAIEFARLEPYGFHKAVSELVVRVRVPRWLILRSSLILGSNLKKGPFYDTLNGTPLFISADSRLQAISTRDAARAIDALVGSPRRNEIFNMGGRGTFPFDNLGELAGVPVAFQKDAKRQIYEMNVEKLNALVPLRTSEEYAKEFLNAHASQKKGEK